MEFISYKKIDKIAQAIYLASHHLKDNEPLKWELRKEGLSFLACARALEESDELKDISLEMAFQSFLQSARELISLLTLGSGSRLLSNVNSRLIAGEIESILRNLEEASSEEGALKNGFVLSEEFFATDPELGSQFKGHSVHKGQNHPFLSGQNKDRNHSSKFAEKDSKKLEAKPIIKDKKDKRQIQILDLLQHHPNLTIKDFARVIPGCSEKTIQRELLTLMKKGMIKREGERRWSRYSLKRQ